MPTVTFLGPLMYRRRTDMSGQWVRGEPVEVSQSWLDRHRHSMAPSQFRIEGDAGITVDEGNDGIPDAGWTKTKMLGMVGNVLNPKAAEENELGEEPTQQNGDE